MKVALPRFRLGGKPEEWAKKVLDAVSVLQPHVPVSQLIQEGPGFQFTPDEYLSKLEATKGFLTYSVKCVPRPLAVSRDHFSHLGATSTAVRPSPRPSWPRSDPSRARTPPRSTRLTSTRTAACLRSAKARRLSVRGPSSLHRSVSPLRTSRRTHAFLAHSRVLLAQHRQALPRWPPSIDHHRSLPRQPVRVRRMGGRPHELVSARSRSTRSARLADATLRVKPGRLGQTVWSAGGRFRATWNGGAARAERHQALVRRQSLRL